MVGKYAAHPANLAACEAVGREVVCLCYHAVSSDWPCALAVRPEQLERHLGWLLENGWTPATFSRALLDPPSHRTVAVTFDDAYLSVLERAEPILSELRIAATVFAPTAFMSSRQQLHWPGIEHWLNTPYASELTSMDWDDLRQLADRGWEIGSHTRTHPHLDELDDVEVKSELAASREECSHQIGRECASLAYPYGIAGRRVATAARDVGYRSAATIHPPREGPDPMRHPRIGIYRLDTPRRFRTKFAARRLYRSPLWRAFTAFSGGRAVAEPQ